MTWPELNYDTLKETKDTLHLWSQIVGKVRTARTPWVNHSWHVTLYVTSRGLATSPIPDGERNFEIELDLLDQRLRIHTSDGDTRERALGPGSIADFHADVLENLEALGIGGSFSRIPNEIPNATPFDEDTREREYEPDAARRLFEALVRVDDVFKTFRARFVGKVSPVHFFWGSFDHAVTRFSGRPAPPHPGGIPALPDWITREAYSHEVSSAGFWPGGEVFPHALFYSYAYPAPDGFSEASVRPSAASFSQEMGEFVLLYDDVRRAKDPEATLLDFFQSTYEAAAELAKWDRKALEHGEPWPPRA